jgi:hypothetical protein
MSNVKIIDAPILQNIERPDFGNSYCHSVGSIPEKVNRCDAHGECTCGFYPDAMNCLYHLKTKFISNPYGCIYYAFNCQCMSVEARKNAKDKQRRTRALFQSLEKTDDRKK